MKTIISAALASGIFLTSNFVVAGTLEDCTIEGKSNGEKVILHWIYNGKNEGFTQPKSQTYGFCFFEQDENNIQTNLACYEADGGNKTAHYRPEEASRLVCDQGCENGAAKVLNLSCKNNDDL